MNAKDDVPLEPFDMELVFQLADLGDLTREDVDQEEDLDPDTVAFRR